LGSAAKAGTDFSVAKGPYGHAYVARRTHCLQTHPDWNRGHLHGDAMRFMTKAVIKDLWRQWCAAEGVELAPDKWMEAAQELAERQGGGSTPPLTASVSVAPPQ